MEAELQQIRTGQHPAFKLEARKLDEVRQRHRAEAVAFCEARVLAAEEECERDTKFAEDELKNEEELLREKFLNDFEDKRRRTDEGRFDGQFSQMRAAAIRKMRTRSNVEAGAAGATAGTTGASSLASKTKREKLTWTVLQFALKPNEVHDDFEELTRLYNSSLRHAEDTAVEEAQAAQAAKKPRVAPEQSKPAVPRKPGARAKAPELDLKGKNPADIPGSRITVWYEESTARGKMDVPYPGTVASLKKDGLSVRFDGSPDDDELITNDDEWLWGEHKKKPAR